MATGNTGSLLVCHAEAPLIQEIAINVLFDLDGTLTDPRQGIVGCMRHALSVLREPIPAEGDLEKFIGPPLRDAFCELLATTPEDERIAAAVTAYRDRFSAEGMFENAVYEGIPQVLSALSSRNAQLFVATSKPHVYAKRILEHFELAQYFRGVYGSELDGRLSNKGELIGHVLAAASLRARDTVMVGDRLHDVMGALQNKVLPVGVLWGYGSREELTAAGAKQLFENPAELARLVV
jgi:phosphoglycolate phosphatase